VSSGPARAGGPLTAVLAAFDTGAHSLAEVAARCGLPPDTVRASVEHLVRMGRLEEKELAIGCPPGGCRSCASGAGDGSAGCGTSASSGRRSGPVLVALSVRRR
jgi:hypothetical protein